MLDTDALAFGLDLADSASYAYREGHPQRVALAKYWQEQAAERYAYARWSMGKAHKQRSLFEAGASNIYHLRRNQFAGDMEAASLMTATARMLMGVS